MARLNQNPVGLAYLKYFPQPDVPGAADGEGNYVIGNPSINNFSSWVGRSDASFGSRNKLSFNMHESTYTQATQDVFHNLATGQFSNTDLWGAFVDDVYTITPTLLLDTRFGYTRAYVNSSIKSAGFDPTQLGFPAYMAASSLGLAMP